MRFYNTHFYIPVSNKRPIRGSGIEDELPLYFDDAESVSEQYIQRTIWNIYRALPYKDQLLKPTMTYDDIRGSMPYQTDLGGYSKFIIGLRSVIHVGQRKLFISELQAMNAMFSDYREAGIIIYAGSAPSMKLWYMMQLYPNAKFLLVDPNEFFIYDGQYDLPHYVRQDPSYLRDGGKWGVYRDRNEREYNQYEYVYLSASKVDMYEGKYYKEKNIVWYNPETGKLEKKYKPCVKGAIGKSERRLDINENEAPMITERANQRSIDYVFESTANSMDNRYDHIRGGNNNPNHRVFFVEEYFTNSIAEYVANASKRYPNIKTAFWSDIRTNVDGNREPGDLDIVLNSAWMYSWVKIMEPTVSMLKFRVPYFNDRDIQLDFDRFKDSFDSAAELGCDFRIPTWKEGKFTFFKGTINLQAWMGSISTETRLIVTKESVINNELVQYDLKEYEDKFMFYERIERLALLHENPNADPEIGFDNCNDCAIENVVWTEYKAKNPQFDIKEGIKKMDKLLHVPIKMRRGIFTHGGLVTGLKMEEFLELIKNNVYTNVRLMIKDCCPELSLEVEDVRTKMKRVRQMKKRV